MATALLILTYLGVILLLGIITSIVSKKFNIPNVLLLLIIGIMIGNIKIDGQPVMELPSLFLTSISILTLVMIIFDSSSRFSIKKLDEFYVPTIKLSLLILFFNILFLSASTMLIFGIDSIIFVLVFSALMSGTDPGVVLTMLKDSQKRVFQFLKLESLINTPLVVLLPFIILEFQSYNGNSAILSSLVEHATPFLQQLVVGVGAGVLVGIIVFKFMKKWYSDTLSPLALITGALLTYTISENLGGNGVLAVTSMGLIFGYVHVKEKLELQEFSFIFSNSLEILVFVLLGMIISIPFNLDFLIKSLLLFIVYLVIRYFAVLITLVKSKFTSKEKLFIALNAQKGIAVAVVIFSLANLKGDGMEIIFNLALVFMIYSILLSTIVIRLERLFINQEVHLASKKGKAAQK